MTTPTPATYTAMVDAATLALAKDIHRAMPIHVRAAKAVDAALAAQRQAETDAGRDDPVPHPEDCLGCRSWEAPVHGYRAPVGDSS